MSDSLAELWDNLENFGVATEEELQLVTDLNGYSEQVLNDILFCRVGYRDWEQYAEAELT